MTTLWQQTTKRQQTIKQHYGNIKTTIKQQIRLNQQYNNIKTTKLIESTNLCQLFSETLT